MKVKVDRRTVDLSAYPDLVVIYLGMRVNAWSGAKTLFGALAAAGKQGTVGCVVTHRAVQRCVTNAPYVLRCVTTHPTNYEAET